MFIRVVKKQRSKDAKVFYQYSLVQAARINNKVKQTVILYLGSNPLLADKTNRTLILNILKSKIFQQPEIFPEQCSQPIISLGLELYEKYCIRYQLDQQEVQDIVQEEGNTDENLHKPTPTPKTLEAPSIPPLPQLADYHQVDIKGLEISEVQSFGGEHLCQQILDKLQLADCLRDCGMKTEQINKALIAIAARALFAASEHKTSQILATHSSLQNLYNYQGLINHKALYAISDQLYKHRQTIDKFLYGRLTDIFNLDDKIVIFDISNTYFETSKPGSGLAGYGRSKEKRNDCPLVVFTAVVNAQGFLKHSRIYEGDKADVTTLEEMLDDLEANTGSTDKEKTVVLDAGIASDENLTMIQSRGHKYVCVARHRLKEYEVKTLQEVTQSTGRGKQQVKLNVFQPEGFEDTWMYVQSDEKRKKEQSMKEKLHGLFTEDLTTVQESLSKKGGTKRIDKVWERIGRMREKHKNVSGQYKISVEEESGKAIEMTWERKAPNRAKQDKEEGVYFIRTNYQNPDEKQLWNIYNSIRKVESTFRCLKTDLNIRPVHHQNDERIESHIYLTILAYQLVNTIRHMLIEKDIHHDWRNVVRIMASQTIQTIEVPTDKKKIYISKPARPTKEVLEIYQATNCKSIIPERKKYVVYH